MGKGIVRFVAVLCFSYVLDTFVCLIFFYSNFKWSGALYSTSACYLSSFFLFSFYYFFIYLIKTVLIKKSCHSTWLFKSVPRLILLGMQFTKENGITNFHSGESSTKITETILKTPLIIVLLWVGSFYK